jgi:hypothetical protein
MHKTLIEMNLHLHTVISDVTGVTGIKIIRDICRGETPPRNWLGIEIGGYVAPKKK